MSDGGKGSNPRPFSVTQDEFGEKYESIFKAQRKFCDVCGRLYSWCTCGPVPKEYEEQLDKAMGKKK